MRYTSFAAVIAALTLALPAFAGTVDYTTLPHVVIRTMENPNNMAGRGENPSCDPVHDTDDNDFLDCGEGFEGMDVRTHIRAVPLHPDGCYSIAECEAEGAPPVNFYDAWQHCHEPNCTPTVPLTPLKEDVASENTASCEEFASSGVASVRVNGFEAIYSGHTIADSGWHSDTFSAPFNNGILACTIEGVAEQGVRITVTGCAGINEDGNNSDCRLRIYDTLGNKVGEFIETEHGYLAKEHFVYDFPHVEAAGFAYDSIRTYNYLNLALVEELELDSDNDGNPQNCDCDIEDTQGSGEGDGVCGLPDQGRLSACFGKKQGDTGFEDCVDADLDANEVIGLSDFGRMGYLIQNPSEQCID
jgi:hypothetical protein